MLEKHMGRMLDDVYQERVNGLLDKLFTEKSTKMEYCDDQTNSRAAREHEK